MVAGVEGSRHAASFSLACRGEGEGMLLHATNAHYLAKPATNARPCTVNDNPFAFVLLFVSPHRPHCKRGFGCAASALHQPPCNTSAVLAFRVLVWGATLRGYPRHAILPCNLSALAGVHPASCCARERACSLRGVA